MRAAFLRKNVLYQQFLGNGKNQIFLNEKNHTNNHKAQVTSQQKGMK